jgi:hypothetical protein
VGTSKEEEWKVGNVQGLFEKGTQHMPVHMHWHPRVYELAVEREIMSQIAVRVTASTAHFCVREWPLWLLWSAVQRGIQSMSCPLGARN